MQHRLLANSVVADESYPLVNGEPCWLWISSTDKDGYGRLNVRVKRGPSRGKVRSVKAHRISIVAFKGRRMTRRMVGSHLCNVPQCINPNHLVGGTVATNNRKCVRDGRHWSGFKGEKQFPTAGATPCSP